MDNDDNDYSFYTPDIDTSSSSRSSYTDTSGSSSTRSSSSHKKRAKKADEGVSIGQIAHTLLSNFAHNLDNFLEERRKRIDPNKKIIINGQTTQQVDQETYKIISPDSEGRVLYINSKGEPHRNEGPAIIYADGKVEYYYHGKLHNANGPAIMCPNGSNTYYSWGLKTRWDGPAETIINEDGSSIQKYYREDKLSRNDGPAVIHSNGEYLYYDNGKLHNEHGPASHLLIKGTTDKFEDEYWIHGKQLSSLQFKMLKLRNKVFKNTINDMRYNR